MRKGVMTYSSPIGISRSPSNENAPRFVFSLQWHLYRFGEVLQDKLA